MNNKTAFTVMNLQDTDPITQEVEGHATDPTTQEIERHAVVLLNQDICLQEGRNGKCVCMSVYLFMSMHVQGIFFNQLLFALRHTYPSTPPLNFVFTEGQIKKISKMEPAHTWTYYYSDYHFTETTTLSTNETQ